MDKKLTKNERNWILYDVGNSAFTLMVSTIFPIYFKYLAGLDGVSDTDYLAYWGYAASISTVFVAILGPILGTISDRKGQKKPLFLGCVVMGCIGCSLLGVSITWQMFLALFVITKIVYSVSLIFYDSMLTDVTTPERMDDVSSRGFAWGYIGSCLPFLLSLGLVLGYSLIGLSFSFAAILAFVVTAVWWLAMTVPLLKSYRQEHYTEKTGGVISSSFRQLFNTLPEIGRNRRVCLYLISFFFYIDGVYTIIEMATAYGESLGLDTTGLLLALLMTQIIAFPCALIFGRLSQNVATEKLIMVGIVAYLLISLFAVQLDQQWEFWLLAACVGMFQGSIQALSRSYFARIIPADKSGEYFGIMDICGKGASFLGTTLVSLMTQLTGSSNLGISAIPVLMVIGLALFVLSTRQTDPSGMTAGETKVKSL